MELRECLLTRLGHDPNSRALNSRNSRRSSASSCLVAHTGGCCRCQAAIAASILGRSPARTYWRRWRPFSRQRRYRYGPCRLPVAQRQPGVPQRTHSALITPGSGTILRIRPPDPVATDWTQCGETSTGPVHTSPIPRISLRDIVPRQHVLNVTGYFCRSIVPILPTDTAESGPILHPRIRLCWHHPRTKTTKRRNYVATQIVAGHLNSP